MDTRRTRYRRLTAVCALLVIATGAILVWRHSSRSSPKLVYTRNGFGGYTTASEKKSDDPLQPALDAYNAGKYDQAEAEARRTIASASKSTDPKLRKHVARAMYILAFSAARRKDLKTARDRFTELRVEAAKLPDKGKLIETPGQPEPTLEEQGAYQHAVCTAALGDNKGAEAEYMKFIADYPESTLITPAAERIRRLHGGHMPKAADEVWTKSHNLAVKRLQAREKAQRTKEAMCGPDSLAIILSMDGKKASPEQLASEMKTDEHGTSLQALSDAAKRRGYNPKGLAVTFNGLRQQKLPVIALIAPGHYVVIHEIGTNSVSTFDPAGQGKIEQRTYSIQAWCDMWLRHGKGVVLALR